MELGYSIENYNIIKPGDLVGSTTTSYIICKLLGKGSFGEVYLAKCSNYGNECSPQQVALKALNCDPIKTKKCLEEAERSIRISRNLENENIVKTIDCFNCQIERGGVCRNDLRLIFIAMEYCVSDLKKEIDCMIINKNIFPPKEIYNYIYQIANGIEELHSKHQITHLDLKPANILISRQEEREVLKIADFGQATVFSDCRCCHSTPLYRCPEQCRSDKCTIAADIYAMGLIFYELCITPIKLEDVIDDIRTNVKKYKKIVWPVKLPQKDTEWLNKMIVCSPNEPMTAANVKQDAGERYRYYNSQSSCKLL